MTEYRRVVVELWRVAADDAAVWLIGGDALYSGPIPQDTPAHFEVENLLTDAGHRSVPIVHSTSWREDGPWTILTYIAVVDPGSDDVLARWPDALPVTAIRMSDVGKPPVHAANQRPDPRNVDVLVHALRHLAHLKMFDDEAGAALPVAWEKHLAELNPALAGLYCR